MVNPFAESARQLKATRLEYDLCCAGHTWQTAGALTTTERASFGRHSDATWDLAVRLMRSWAESRRAPAPG